MNKKKAFYSYFISSVLLFIFQWIYHHFSHGVTSQALRWVWVIPMVGGAFLFIFKKILNTFQNRLAFNLFNTGLTSYIVGMILKGILEIAGTSSPYIGIYPMIGMIILGISLFIYISSLLIHGLDKWDNRNKWKYKDFFQKISYRNKCTNDYFSDIYFAISIDIPKFQLKCFNLIPI